MTELLTRSERENLSRIRREKWERIQKAEPALVSIMNQLNAPFTHRWKEYIRHQTVEKSKLYQNGCEARINWCKINGSMVVGK